MKKVDWRRLVEALIILTFGLLVAILKNSSIDIYFGVTLIVVGLSLVVLMILTIKKERFVPIPITFAGLALLSLGIAALTPLLTFQMIVVMLLVAAGAFGLTLIIKGIELITRRATILGVLIIMSGAALLTIAILYFAVESFQAFVWILLGVFICGYGVVEIVYAISGKNLLEKK